MDDEIEMCFMVSNLLRHHGYDVATAENVEVALSMCDSIPLSLIILDVNLGGEDGFKLVSFLKKNHPDVPIILYTGVEHDEELIKEALAEGASKYLRKGGPLDELVTAVQNAMPI